MSLPPIWTSVHTARSHGWNVRKAEIDGIEGWQVAELTLSGWQWRPFSFPSKARALRHAWTIHTSPMVHGS